MSRSNITLAHTASVSLATNLVYAAGNLLGGFLSKSWWFVTIGAYYLVLASTRAFVLFSSRKANAHQKTEICICRVTGVLLLLLSFCLTGINVLSIVESRGSKLHEIVMIAIATFTFVKITTAIIGLFEARRKASLFAMVLRNIALADAVVSIYALQRSMLVSFGDMRLDDVRVFNILTGTLAFIIVLLLGINLIGGKHITMAKSKLVEANKKIAETVTSGYKKIEDGVVSGYKKIEEGVVSGYSKIEDKFVDSFLTHEGENVDEAKNRLKGRAPDRNNSET